MRDVVEGWQAIGELCNRSPSWARWMASDGMEPAWRMPVEYMPARAPPRTPGRRRTPVIERQALYEWLVRWLAGTTTRRPITATGTCKRRYWVGARNAEESEILTIDLDGLGDPCHAWRAAEVRPPSPNGR